MSPPIPRSRVDLTLAGSRADAIRRIVLEQSKRAGVGHIGSALSIVDIVAALYSGALHGAFDDPDRDRFVLSKGHAVLAVYAALFERGTIDRAVLDTYSGDDTMLGSHPEHVLPGIDFCTGSLGTGLSLGAGAALAARYQSSDRRAFVLVSDAECNEGSTWEAAMFAAHHKLDNLVAVIDFNGQQALGYTRDVMDATNMPERWASFGWDVTDIDGHDLPALGAALDKPGNGAPRVVVARTTFGKGVSYMENEIPWHYLPMNDDQYGVALAEIGAVS